jgi:hypothetical protein
MARPKGKAKKHLREALERSRIYPARKPKGKRPISSRDRKRVARPNMASASVTELRAKYRAQYGAAWSSDAKVKAKYDAEKRALSGKPASAPAPRVAAERPAPKYVASKAPSLRGKTCDDCGNKATHSVWDEEFGAHRPFCSGHATLRAYENPRRRHRARRNTTEKWILMVYAPFVPAKSARAQRIDHLKMHVVDKVYPTEQAAWDAYFDNKVGDYFYASGPIVRQLK